MPSLQENLQARNPYYARQKEKRIALILPSDYSKGRARLYTDAIKNSNLSGCEIKLFTANPKHTKLFELKRITSELYKYAPCLIINASNLYLQFAASGKPLTVPPVKGQYHYSSYVCTGSVYWLDLEQQRSVKLEYITKTETDLVPCLNIYEDSKILYTMNHARWFLNRILNKCAIYTVIAKPQQGLKKYPKFTYSVCTTKQALQEFEHYANKATLISLDIETSGMFITCIGYSCIEFDSSMLGYSIKTFVVPFFRAENNQFTTPWQTFSDETEAWETIRRVHRNDSIKIMQNGANYDGDYFIRYDCPLYNFTLDTLYLINALYVELPKKIDFQAALFLSHSAYWKNESKTEQKAKSETKATALPRTSAAYTNYLMYNAKDCYYTALVALELLAEYSKPEHDYAYKAYAIKLSLQLGPLFRANLIGFPLNKEFNEALLTLWEMRRVNASMEFAKLTSSMPVNTNSPSQVSDFIYNVMGFPEIPRKGKSGDKKDLAIIKEIDPLADAILTPLLKAKEAGMNLSKYQNLYKIQPHAVFMYSLNAAGTKTDRFSGAAHSFHVGTNPQNIPYEFRLAMQAPKGHFLVKFDYSQSDMYFTAFRLNDSKMIANVMSDKDTHCLHCSEFFKESYEILAAATANHEQWVVDNQTGVRSITKRIVYGANYGMYGFTLFITMGFKALQFTAKKLKRPHTTFEDIIACADFLLNFYRTEIYADQQKLLDKEYEIASANNGYVKSVLGGKRKFFGDVYKPSNKRGIASYFGQNGTAQNMNRAIMRIFNNEKLTNLKVRCILQVHDELVYAIPREVIHESIKIIQTLMMPLLEVNDHKFTVPTEPEIGLGYGKRLIEYRKEESLLTVEELTEKLITHDKKLLAKLRTEVLNEFDSFTTMIT